MQGFQDLPLHHQLFLKVRDGGHDAADGVARLHEISLEELKAHCLKACEELIDERGHLEVYEHRVYAWAKS